MNTIYDLSLTTYDLRFTIYRLSDFDTYNLRFWSTKCSSKFIGCRAGFSIENVQQALDNYSESLVQTRYWSTEPLQTKSFNDFVIFKTVKVFFHNLNLSLVKIVNFLTSFVMLSFQM